MGTTACDPLQAYCSNLARSPGHVWPPQFVEYPNETAAAFAILARRYDPAMRDHKKANPIWVDADGTERAAVKQGAVAAWSQGDLSPSLKGQRLLELDYEAVMEGVDARALNEQMSAIRARYPRKYCGEELERDPRLTTTSWRHMQEIEDWRRGNEADQRVRAVVHALRDLQGAGTPVVLFVNHIHRILGGEGEYYPFDLTAVLKPLLHRCQIQLWGACTLTEYRSTIERDASMQRCFAAVSLPSARRG